MKKILRLMLALCFLIMGIANASARVLSTASDQETARMYAFSLNQDTYQTGLVSFDLKQSATLAPIGEESATPIAAGAGVNEVFYAASNTGFGPGKANLYLVNTQNGELTTLGQLTANLLDMAYDYSSEKMYGISMNRGNYTLHTVNLINGTLATVANFQTPVAAVACDKQGQLYGFGTDGKLYKVDKTTAGLTEIGTMGITPYSRQSMEFDHATGKLYLIAATENNYSVLYRVDLATGNATEVQSYKDSNAFLSALYIPFTAEQEVPDPLLAYTFNKDLSQVVTFDLNSPSTFTGFKDLGGVVLAGTGANDILYFIYDEYGYLSLKQLKLKTKQLGGIDPALDRTLLDMAYDYTTETMYGIATNEGTSSLYVVSLSKVAEKRFDKKGDFNAEIVALSCDKAGQLYGLGKDSKLYKVNKADAVLTEIGATGATLGVKQAMEFDRATGKLYLISTTAEDYSILYVINDVADGAATQLHTYQEDGASLASLYIPYTLPAEQSVGSLKEMKEAGASDLPYQVTGEVLVTGARKSENSAVFYVEDETAAIAVNYTGVVELTYRPGDKLKDLKGKLAVNGTVHSLAFESATKVSGDNPIIPLTITIPELKTNAQANEARLVKIENALLELDGDEFHLIQQEESVKITAASKEGMDLLNSLKDKQVIYTGNVTIEAETGTITLEVTSLVETLDPLLAYTFNKDLSQVVTFDLNSPSAFTGFKDLDGGVLAGTGANDILYFIYDEYGYLSLKQLKLKTKQLGGIDPTLEMALLDMAYDYTTETMYGIATTEGTSSLFVVSLSKVTEKRFDKKGDFNAEIVALSCDKAGQLYGLGKDGKLYKVNKADAVLTVIGATGATLGVKQAMEFDRATGKLYLISTTAEDYSILYVINDVADGAATQLHTYQEDGASLASLYIPYTLPAEQSIGSLKEMKEAGASDLPYQVTGEVLVTGVRKSENSAVFYVEDETAAIAVNYTGVVELTYRPGDKLKDLKGKLTVDGTVHSLAFESATKVSGDHAVTPTLQTVTEINAGYPANEATFVRIENALASKENESYVLIQGGTKVLATGEESELQKRQGQAVVVTGHVESATDGIVMLLLDEVQGYSGISDLGEVNNFYCENSRIVAEGAERIEIYDVAGRQVIVSGRESVSVKGMQGMIIAKAMYANGEVKLSKFVVK